jgi:hypothetical protein
VDLYCIGLQTCLASDPDLPLRMRAQETQEFWRQVLERVDRPTAKKLADGLDLSQPLGYAVGSKDGKGGSALVRFMVSVKRTHPTKVLLVRVRARAGLLQPHTVDR